MFSTARTLLPQPEDLSDVADEDDGAEAAGERGRAARRRQSGGHPWVAVVTAAALATASVTLAPTPWQQQPVVKKVVSTAADGTGTAIDANVEAVATQSTGRASAASAEPRLAAATTPGAGSVLKTAGTGCKNWRVISMGPSVVHGSAGACLNRCRMTPGCQGVNFQKSACKGEPRDRRAARGSCYLLGETCAEGENTCWDLYILPVSERMVVGGGFSSTLSGIRLRTGCSNMDSITRGRPSKEWSLYSCKLRCNLDPGCRGIMYQAGSCGGSTAAGARRHCRLLYGECREADAGGCWDVYHREPPAAGDAGLTGAASTTPEQTGGGLPAPAPATTLPEETGGEVPAPAPATTLPDSEADALTTSADLTATIDGPATTLPSEVQTVQGGFSVQVPFAKWQEFIWSPDVNRAFQGAIAQEAGGVPEADVQVELSGAAPAGEGRLLSEAEAEVEVKYTIFGESGGSGASNVNAIAEKLSGVTAKALTDEFKLRLLDLDQGLLAQEVEPLGEASGPTIHDVATTTESAGMFHLTQLAREGSYDIFVDRETCFVVGDIIKLMQYASDLVTSYTIIDIGSLRLDKQLPNDFASGTKVLRVHDGGSPNHCGPFS